MHIMYITLVLTNTATHVRESIAYVIHMMTGPWRKTFLMMYPYPYLTAVFLTFFILHVLLKLI